MGSASLKIGLLGNRDSWYVNELSRAGNDRGHDCLRIDYRGLVAAEETSPRHHCTHPVVAVRDRGDERRDRRPAQIDDITTLDALIVRTMPPGSLEQVVFRMDVLARLEAAGVCVVNSPKAIECAVDKYLATAQLATAVLPVPATIVCQDAESAMEAFDQLGGDVVVKPLFGSEGRGIVRVSDPDLAFRTFRTLERIQAVLYLQQFIDHEGFDVRVLLLDGQILGAMKRRSGDDFRTNVARTAVGELHNLTDDEADLARRAVLATRAAFAGVDLLYDRAGQCYVLEVNAVPGWRAFGRVTGVDVATQVMTWLERRCRQSPDA